MKTTQYILLTYLLLLICTAIHAQSFSGRVTNEQSHHGLQGADICTKDGKRLALTDKAGNFAFETDATTIDVTVFLHGYEHKKLRLKTGVHTEVQMKPLSQALDEVTVMAYRTKRGNNAFSYSASDVKKINTLVGETDVMRYLQVLPGVSQGMEGGMGIYVRGGGNGNNRVELDGVPVFSPTHLFGLFSTFHTDIIDKATFQMGGIDAASGNLLSSLLRIETQKPNAEKYSGAASLSPLMVSGALQGYIIKNKLSFQIAGRTSLLRSEYLLAKKIFGEESITDDFNPQVQDGYAKLHWKINQHHTAEAMAYGSHDYFAYMPEKDKYDMTYNVSLGWDNKLAMIRWNYTSSGPFRMETSAYYSHFKTRQRQVENTEEEFGKGVLMGAEKTVKAFKSQLFTHLKGVDVNAGIDYRQQNFRPTMQTLLLNADTEMKNNSIFNTSIASIFAEGEYVISRYKMKGGLRYNLFQDNDNHAHHNAEIRLQGSVFLTKNMGIETTFDRLTQFQHTLEGLPVGWALDLVIPASRNLKPETSNQWYLGGFWGNSQFYVTVGGYYRQLTNLTAYKSFTNLFSTKNMSWEDNLSVGKGTSYGLEVWLEKRNSRWTGSLAYTLSKTNRKFPEINEGHTFPFKFDRPHNLNIQSQYITVKKERHEQRVNVALFFTSGNNITIPVTSYKAEELPYWDKQIKQYYTPPLQQYYARVRVGMSSVNGYRMPAYIRADLGYSFLWKRKRLSHELTISAFNIFNRNNPYLIFYEHYKWQQLSIMPIVPTIRWEIRF